MEFKQRNQNSHKGTFGKILNIAGSKYMPGAAYLSSVSALKIGAGYCFLAAEDTVIQAVAAQTQNVVFKPLFSWIDDIETFDVISIGCGLSMSNDAKWNVKKVIKYSKVPTVIDADGLNILAKLDLTSLPTNTNLTPHPAEAARLLRTTVDDITSNLEKNAKNISEMYNCVTVLKSHNTVVCSKDLEIYVNNTGNSALAKAGSGDVLTGMIAGLLAQKMSLFESAKMAVHLHGLCGELASKDLTEYSVMADDLINYIPMAIKSIL